MCSHLLAIHQPIPVAAPPQFVAKLTALSLAVVSETA
jgi:hypothetical protein